MIKDSRTRLVEDGLPLKWNEGRKVCASMLIQLYDLVGKKTLTTKSLIIILGIAETIKATVGLIVQ